MESTRRDFLKAASLAVAAGIGLRCNNEDSTSLEDEVNKFRAEFTIGDANSIENAITYKTFLSDLNLDDRYTAVYMPDTMPSDEAKMLNNLLKEAKDSFHSSVTFPTPTKELTPEEIKENTRIVQRIARKLVTNKHFKGKKKTGMIAFYGVMLKGGNPQFLECYSKDDIKELAKFDKDIVRVNKAFAKNQYETLSEYITVHANRLRLANNMRAAKIKEIEKTTKGTNIFICYLNQRPSIETLQKSVKDTDPHKYTLQNSFYKPTIPVLRRLLFDKVRDPDHVISEKDIKPCIDEYHAYKAILQKRKNRAKTQPAQTVGYTAPTEFSGMHVA